MFFFASGGYLSCFGKKDTKEADQGEALRYCSRNNRRPPLGSSPARIIASTQIVSVL